MAALSVFAGCGARTGLDVGNDGAGVGASGGGGDGAGAGGSGVGGVEQMALGGGHTCVRTKQGDVFCWGRNANGQLGVMTFEGQSEVPVKVPLPGKATLLAAGTYHTCAVTEDGALHCWGRGDDGQIGTGALEDALQPVTLGIQGVVRLALGEQHTCAVAARQGEIGDLYCWGSGGLGQTGVISQTLTVPFMLRGGVGEVAAGAFHTCFLDEDGLTLCMGSNTDGECGISGPVGMVVTPQKPEGLGERPATRVYAGGRSGCVETDGNLRCWGDNSTGQLGLGFASDSELGTEVPLPAGELRGVALGTTHTCALLADAPFCWGDNFSGQLGVATPGIHEPTPLGLLGVRAIGAGSVHSCAYVSPSEIYCWGTNAFGQLGNGEASSTPSLPVKIELP